MDWLLYESDLRHKRGNGLSIVFNMLKVINKDIRTAPVTHEFIRNPLMIFEKISILDV